MSKLQKIENLALESSDERLYILVSTKVISMYYYELQYGYRFPREWEWVESQETNTGIYSCGAKSFCT
ncbi:MAG TPA: hypothetical protein DF613_02105 [Lachnospiraceae bacterium]|nr:hypothetical protein [Lachnospiraceae bacterium]